MRTSEALPLVIARAFPPCYVVSDGDGSQSSHYAVTAESSSIKIEMTKLPSFMGSFFFGKQKEYFLIAEASKQAESLLKVDAGKRGMSEAQVLQKVDDLRKRGTYVSHVHELWNLDVYGRHNLLRMEEIAQRIAKAHPVEINVRLYQE